MATTSGGHGCSPPVTKNGGPGFYRPALPAKPMARKCIVCGTTKLEDKLRPFLLKDERLNVWTSIYFRHKPQRRVSFYSKLRYTMNPFACIEHFYKRPAPPPAMPKVREVPRKTGRRTCEDLLEEGEEPPSIEKITERRPSPPPEERKDARSEGEVNDAIMSILKKAVVEMEKEGELTKKLTKFTRNAMTGEDFEQDEPAPVVRKKKKMTKKRRGGEKAKRVVDGNEADSDNSTIDVEAIDSEYSEESSAEEESDIEDVTPVVKPKLTAAVPARAPPPRIMFIPRRPRPLMRPYVIAAPSGRPSRPPPAMIRGHPAPPVMSAVPKRLTLNAGTGGNYQRLSWIPANPGQRTLASILQSVWNEDGYRSGGEQQQQHSMKIVQQRLPTRIFGRTVLPGTRTRFIPASTVVPPPKQQQPPSLLHPSIRTSALLNNPPISPSRLIIASEETVETTLSDTESKKASMSDLGSSSEEEDGGSEWTEVDVYNNAGHRTPAAGQMIEGGVEEKGEGNRSRTISTVLSVSSEELEMESSEAENSEIDVETVEEPKVEKKRKKKKKREKKVEAAAADIIPIADPPLPTKAPAVHTDRRKASMSDLGSSSKEEDGRSEGTEVDVRDNSGHRTPAAGKMIEGGVEEKGEGNRSRSISTVLSVSSEELEMESSEAENAEIDVETVEEPKVEKKRKKKKVEAEADVIPIDDPPPPTKAAAVRTDRRKQRMPPPCSVHRYHQRYQRPVPAKKFIVPPTAVVNPPTKLLSAEQYSVKEALHAQARAAAVQPVRIDTTGLLGPPVQIQRIRPKDMPRLLPQLARKRQSEWSRLEEVVERKAAQQTAQLIAAATRRIRQFKEGVHNIDDAPPMLEEEAMERTIKATRIRIEDGYPLALIKSLAQSFIDQELRRSKVLRIRFHKKDEEVDVSAMKVLSGCTRPQGVVREEEVGRAPALSPNEKKKEETLAKKEREQKRTQQFPTVVRAVPRPSLVIEKAGLLEAAEKANAPPPTPVVGIPCREAFQQRREMYEQKRHDEMMRGILYGRMRQIREETLRRKIDLMGGMEREEEDKDDADLDAEAVKVLQMVRAEKEKAQIVEAAEAEKRRRREEAEKGVLVISDIETDGEKEEKMEEGVKDEKDGEWRMTGRKGKKMEEENEEDGNRRKSHRLREKRASGRKWDPIWKMSDDEDLPADEQPEAPVEKSEKKKRGRPRKNPEGPPPKKKREESRKMTVEEKEMLSRLLTSSIDGENGEPREEQPPKIEEEPAMMTEEALASDAIELEAATDPRGETGEADEMPAPLERQEPKAAGDGPAATAKRRRAVWSWKQRLDADAATGETMTRLCQLCLAYSKRHIWIPNESLALMDHARTHCVETLMCPSRECTYMNTTRARISQHVTYVHKRWGMPIDLSEVYPPLRMSLTLRLHQCFPDLPHLSVCRICRVAVRQDPHHHRWHAQTHLETRVFECSRDICMVKFHSEQDCFEHIQNARCHGSIVNGMTAEMDAQVTVLVSKCFGTKLFPVSNARKAEVSVVASGGYAHSATASSSTSQQMESEENEEMPGPSRCV